MSPFLLIIIADIEAFFLGRIDSSYLRKQNGLGLGGTKQYNHLKNSGDENERCPPITLSKKPELDDDQSLLHACF